MTEKTVGIHQPNFFPWLGYFHKMAASDTFILLDDVAIPKTGGSYVNRVKMLVQGSPQWMTCPVVRETKGRINAVKIDERKKWRQKLANTLTLNYKKTPFFEETMEWLEPLLFFPTEHLSELNSHAIQAIAELLEISCDIRFQSQIGSTKESTELLIDLVKKVGGHRYLSGMGGANYQNPERFTSSGLILAYQNFTSPAYPQYRNKQFVPGLSLLDSCFNIGLKATQQIVHSN
ncbi:hypothetical protein GCM10011391_20440 [Pullulanibacillus camelliae]|uniref:WbmP n=1 Tax=Pullulanibacillus camelliae TaxID=1707096 RepID=A0A8J2W0U2_9BACL|nr:WbqC family protein [Pullulanibacillus camelliae]GGE41591.1 hypothetical protein GCM10011391_20440 [Pullulanibacillus camelliae]